MNNLKVLPSILQQIPGLWRQKEPHRGAPAVFPVPNCDKPEQKGILVIAKKKYLIRKKGRKRI